MRLFADSVTYNCTLHQANPTLPYLMMLHGFMGSKTIFKPFIGDLCSFCNPLTIDLAGHGKSECPAEAGLFSPERQRAQIHSVLKRLALNPLYMYGYSMGGRLAFQLMAGYADSFAGAIIESAHCGITDEAERSRRAEDDEQRAIEIESDFKGFIENWSRLPLFDDTPPDMKKIYTDAMASQQPDRIASSLRGFGAGAMPPVCHELAKTGIPVQLIAGGKDYTYVKHMKEMESLNPLFSLEIVDGCGHRVHAGKPKEWLHILRQFMKS